MQVLMVRILDNFHVIVLLMCLNMHVFIFLFSFGLVEQLFHWGRGRSLCFQYFCPTPWGRSGRWGGGGGGAVGELHRTCKNISK